MERNGEKGRYTLLALCLVAALFGIALIFSATRYAPDLHSLPLKQGAALLAGLLLCALLSRLDLREITRRLWWLLLLGNVGLLLLLVPLGNDDGTGNKSWISLPGGLFNLQPAEVGKLIFILLLALQLTKGRERGLNRPKTVLLLGLHALGLCGLLYLVSGDIGMVAVYLAIYAVMVWAAGLSPLWLLGEGLAGAGAVVLLWPRLPDYVRMRFQVVLNHSLDPLGKGFQQERSLLAIGSGRVTGQGYLHGTQTQSLSPSALPARHTDFLFSVAGEELGLVGCLLILVLLGAIVLRCVHISRTSEDGFLSLVAAGFGGMLAAQTILNVGMCLYAAPVVGVTLPFFSYGGSSLLTGFGGVGLLLSLETGRAGNNPSRQ